MTTTKTGIGMKMENGDVPAPFAAVTIIKDHHLQDLNFRFGLVMFGSILIWIYLMVAFLINELVPSDLIFFVGGFFLMYRAGKISDKIYEIEQYIDGEEVLALD